MAVAPAPPATTAPAVPQDPNAPQIGGMSMADLINYLGSALPSAQLPAGTSDPLSQAYLTSSTQRAIAALNAAQALAQQQQTAQLRQTELMGADPSGNMTNAAAQWRAELAAQQGVQEANLQQRLLQLMGVDSAGNQTLESRTAGQTANARMAELLGYDPTTGARTLAGTTAMGYDQFGRPTLAAQNQTAQQQAQSAQLMGWDQFGRPTLAGQAQQANQAQQQADQARQTAAQMGYDQYGNVTLAGQAQQANQANQQADQARQMAQLLGYTSTGNPTLDAQRMAEQSRQFAEAQRAAESQFARTYGLQTQASERATGELTGSFNGNLTEAARAARAKEALDRANTAAALGQNPRDVFKSAAWFKQITGNDPSGIGLSGGNISGFTMPGKPVPGTVDLPTMMAALYGNQEISTPQAGGSLTPLPPNSFDVAGPANFNIPGNPGADYQQINNLPVWNASSNPGSAFQGVNNLPVWQANAGGNPYATSVWNPSADPSLTAPSAPMIGSTPLTPGAPGPYTPPAGTGVGLGPAVPPPPNVSSTPGVTPGSSDETGGTPSTDPSTPLVGTTPRSGWPDTSVQRMMGDDDRTSRQTFGPESFGRQPGGPTGPVLGMGAGGNFYDRAPSPLQDPTMMAIMEKIALIAKKKGKGSRSNRDTPARLTLRPDDEGSKHDMQSRNDQQRLMTAAAVQDHKNKKRIANALMKLGGIPGMGPGGPVDAPLYPTDGGTSTPTLQSPSSLGAAPPSMSMAPPPASSTYANPLAAFATNPPGFADTGAIDAHQAAIAQALGQGVQSFAPQTFARMNDSQKQILQGALVSLGLNPKDFEEAVAQSQFANTGSAARA